MQYPILLQMLTFLLGNAYIFEYPSPLDHEKVNLLTRHITDDFERNVMATQLLYCPLFPMCRHLQWVNNYSESVYDSTFYKSCCKKIIDGDVCSKDLPDTSISCVRPQYKQKSTVFNTEAYLMKTTCSKSYKNMNLVLRCEQHVTDVVDVSLSIPVYSKSSGNVYKNMYCALCNFERKEFTENWFGKVLCYKSVSFSNRVSSEREIVQTIQRNGNCNILFYNASPQNLSHCDWIKYSRCNETGRWRHYDKTIERGCHSYTSIYRNEYKNVFCYKCNEDMEPAVRCNPMPTGPLDVGSFAGLLDFSTEPEKVEHKRCPDSTIFISQQNICRNVSCPPFYKYNGNSKTCDPMFVKVSNVKYIIFYNVTLDVDNQNHSLVSVVKDRHQFLEHLVNEIVFKNLTREYSTFAIYSETYANIPNDSLHEDTFVLRVEFTEYGLHDQKQFLRHLTYSRFSQILYNGRNISVVFQLLPPQTEQTKTTSANIAHFQTFSSYSEPVDTVVVTHDYYCPRIEIDRNQSTRSDDNLKIFSLLGSYTFETAKESDNHTTVCLEEYIRALTNSETKQLTPKSYTVEQILSLVGSTISVLSLICLLLVYAVCTELRTIPGINNIILACHLIVANIIYLFGFHSTNNFSLCVAIGLSIHYCWLTSILWMNICSVHMFRVFVIMMKNPTTNHSRRVIIIYAVYVNLVAVLLVCVNIINYFAGQQDKGYLGYGGDQCYITYPYMVLYTFAIPVGCILIANLLLFCIVIYKVQRLPEVGSAHGKNRNIFAIYTKLSCLTGLTWIFGYIHQWTLIAEFSYLFIILNASQGFFIFLSFGCTARVRRICRSKLAIFKTQTSSDTSKNATPLTAR